MARKGWNGAVLLDWFNVTYRSLWITALMVVVLGTSGGYLWYRYAQGPRRQAEEAIERAATLMRKAQAVEADERVEELRSNARVALDEARSLFDDHDHDGARIAAIRSENLSLRAIDMASGSRASGQVRFYRIEGDVRVKRSGEFVWRPAEGRMTLREGDQVKTASSASAQVIYFDGTVTTIEPGSLLEIRQLDEDPVTKVRRVREKLNWGELMASTEARNVEGSYHEVSTEQVAARSQEKSRLRVAYDKQDGTGRFDVFEGRIEVSAPDRKESLAAGERIRARADGRLSAKESLPGTPRLLAPSDEKVFVHEDPASLSLSLSWEPVAGAEAYHLEISNRALFTDPLYDARRKETTVTVEGFGADDYYWRVAAVSRAGVEGPFSPARRLRVSSQVLRDRRDTTPPELRITEFVPVGSMLIVNGVTEPGATLWIDAEKVDVSDDGTFYSVVRLRREGVNEIRFVAQDNAGNETTLDRSAYIDPF